MSRRSWMLPSEDKIGRSLVQGPSRRSPGAAKRVVPVVAAIAVVAAIISGGAMLLLGGASGQIEEAVPETPSANYGIGIPPPPYVVYGWTYEADGTTPLPGCNITVTNVRLGMSNWTETDVDGNYNFDLNLIGGEDLPYLDGDEILVESEKDMLYESETIYVDTAIPYIEVSFTMDTVIPEFPMVILPVAGMLALFAVVRMRRRRDEEA